MDELAASLDPIMESELYEHFTDELKGKTIIITSHQLGACSLANYIYVFDHGEIIEEGSHENLMKSTVSITKCILHREACMRGVRYDVRLRCIVRVVNGIWKFKRIALWYMNL